MSSYLVEHFNRAPWIGTLSTAGADGTVDVAVYMILEPGEGLMDWKGIRVCPRLKDLASSGPAFDDCTAQVTRVVGEASASMLHALAVWEVTGSGRSWTWPMAGNARSEPVRRKETGGGGRPCPI